MDEFTKKRIIKIMDYYISNKIPLHLQNQIKLNYKIRGSNVTLFQERPAFKSDKWVQLDIAQFRQDDAGWKVYWKDSRGKWHHIEEIEPDDLFENQLIVVDQDENGMFSI